MTEKIKDEGGDVKADGEVERDEDREVDEDEKWTTEKIKDGGGVGKVDGEIEGVESKAGPLISINYFFFKKKLFHSK